MLLKRPQASDISDPDTDHKADRHEHIEYLIHIHEHKYIGQYGKPLRDESDDPADDTGGGKYTALNYEIGILRSGLGHFHLTARRGNSSESLSIMIFCLSSINILSVSSI